MLYVLNHALQEGETSGERAGPKRGHLATIKTKHRKERTKYYSSIRKRGVAGGEGEGRRDRKGSREKGFRARGRC